MDLMSYRGNGKFQTKACSNFPSSKNLYQTKTLKETISFWCGLLLLKIIFKQTINYSKKKENGET